MVFQCFPKNECLETYANQFTLVIQDLPKDTWSQRETPNKWNFSNLLELPRGPLGAIESYLQSANVIAGLISPAMKMMKPIAKTVVLTMKPASAWRTCSDTVGVMSGLNWHQMDPCRTIKNLYLEPSGTTWHHVGPCGSIRSHLRAIWEPSGTSWRPSPIIKPHEWGLGFRVWG